MISQAQQSTSVCISWSHASGHSVYPTIAMVNAVAMLDAVIIVIKSSWSLIYGASVVTSVLVLERKEKYTRPVVVLGQIVAANGRCTLLGE